jgi:predicted helicase
MAPYAVAHMKLGLQLAELGYKFDTEERLRVYLTNTLQEAFRIPPAEEHFSSLFWGEADAANRIKEIAPVMVILGNPPYSGHSANNGDWIKNLLKGKDTLTEQLCSNYFEVDGESLNERNPKYLNDDYVKFIRFAQWRIERTGYGVMAFVTNHGYLDNPTFRGMRESLTKTFNDIYVLDLHGNSRIKEKCPDGSKDENVFDVQQGIAISIFVKHPNGKKEKATRVVHGGNPQDHTRSTVHHADLWGDRDRKYNWLEKNDLTVTQWTTFKPQSPFHLFIPQDNELKIEYEQGCKVTEIMPINVHGFHTKRDKFAIDFERENLQKRIEEMRDESISDYEYAEKYEIKDNRDWKLREARKAIRCDAEWQNKLISCLYRPFDKRSCYFSTVAIDYPRRELINHVAGKDNLVLNLPRIVKLAEWRHALIADVPCTAISMDVNGSYAFPLWLYPETNTSQPSVFEKEQRNSNFSQDFLDDITEHQKPSFTTFTLSFILPLTAIATLNFSKSTSPVFPLPAMTHYSAN